MKSCSYPKQIRGNIVGCGTCPACVGRRTWEYSARIAIEVAASERTWFATLTLAKEMSDTEAYAEVQKMLKRLRKAGHAVRYAFVPERGELKGRLHYHAVIHCSDALQWKTLAAAWPHGFSRHRLIKGKGMHRVRSRKTGDFLPLEVVQRLSSRYVSKYVTKSWERRRKGDKVFRFSQGYGGATLRRSLEGDSTISAVLAEWPDARIHRVRVVGINVPRKLLGVEGAAPNLPPLPEELRADYLAWRRSPDHWWKSLFLHQPEFISVTNRGGWRYPEEETAEGAVLRLDGSEEAADA